MRFAETGWMTIGGTSLSSPLISALYALAGGSHGVELPRARRSTNTSADASPCSTSPRAATATATARRPPSAASPRSTKVRDVDCLGTTACDAAPGFDGPSGVGAPIGLSAFGGPGIVKPPSAVTGHATEVEGGSGGPQRDGQPGRRGSERLRVRIRAPARPSPRAFHARPRRAPADEAVAVSAQLTGLTPKTAYHFRLSATTTAGTSTGKTKKFKAH